MTTTTADRVAHRVTRDALMATRTGSLADYSATSDSYASYAILGPVPGDPESVYGIGRRHQNLVMITRTGTVNVRGRGDQVRVRIRFAFDTGDLAGTLGFVTAGAGGVAPRVLFG